MRLQNTLDYQKEQFYTARAEWKETKDSELLTELSALVAAINAIEVYLYDQRITVITDCVLKSILERELGG